MFRPQRARQTTPDHGPETTVDHGPPPVIPRTKTSVWWRKLHVACSHAAVMTILCVTTVAPHRRLHDLTRCATKHDYQNHSRATWHPQHCGDKLKYRDPAPYSPHSTPLVANTHTRRTRRPGAGRDGHLHETAPLYLEARGTKLQRYVLTGAPPG